MIKEEKSFLEKWQNKNNKNLKLIISNIEHLKLWKIKINS